MRQRSKWLQTDKRRSLSSWGPRCLIGTPRWDLSLPHKRCKNPRASMKDLRGIHLRVSGSLYLLRYRGKVMTHRYAFLLSFLLAAVACGAQTGVRVDVDLAKSTGKFTPIYSWFGFDESGYTSTQNGQAL